MAGDYEDAPVLPSEAEDLGTHVEQCAKRYAALIKLIRSVRQETQRMQWEQRVFYAFVVLPIAYIAWEILKFKLTN